MWRSGLIALILIACGVPLAATNALAGTPTDDLRWLNERRAANGIPAGIALNPLWSQRCERHLEYMRATRTITHIEDPSSPFFTADGDWAARRAVLASMVPWTETRFIWEDAPLHMAQLLAPHLAVTGIADDGQLTCVTTWPGYSRPVPPTTQVMTYPGNATRARARVFTNESPFTPAGILGLDQPTGPHLYVYQWGPTTIDGLDESGALIGIRSATLRGPEGLVPLRWVDRRHPAVGQYLPPASGILIPTRPLAENDSYNASVTFTNGIDHTWNFTTDGPPETSQIQRIRISTRLLKVQRSCSRRVAGDCVAWRRTFFHAFTIRGRVVKAATQRGIPRVPIAIAFRGAERPVFPTLRDGTFQATYQVRSTNRRYSMSVTVRVADAITGSYFARFR